MSDILNNIIEAVTEVYRDYNGTPVEIRCSLEGRQLLRARVEPLLQHGGVSIAGISRLMDLPVVVTNDPADHPYRILYAVPVRGVGEESP